MNTRDLIITALTPGTPFNSNNLIWRSIQALSQFAGCSLEETLELIAGDLADVAVVRPSAAGKGLLAALKEHIPQAANNGEGEVVAVAGGPAFNAPLPVAPEPMDEAVELAEPPAHPQEQAVVGGLPGQIPEGESECGVPDCPICAAHNLAEAGLPEQAEEDIHVAPPPPPPPALG